MDLGIAGKRALVLGGNRGIGFGIARALCMEGVDVAITGRDEGRLAAAAEELRGVAGTCVEPCRLDLQAVDRLPEFAA